MLSKDNCARDPTFRRLLLDVGQGSNQMCDAGFNGFGESSAITSDEFLELDCTRLDQLLMAQRLGVEEPWG